MKISFRCPEWMDKTRVTVSVNGKSVEAELNDGYYTVECKWKDGDTVEISLPMTLRAVQLPDKSNYYSFMYGPVVLASDLGKERLDGQFADDSRGGHIASGPQLPLQNMPVIVGEKSNILSYLKRTSPDRLEFKLSGLCSSKGLQKLGMDDVSVNHAGVYDAGPGVADLFICAADIKEECEKYGPTIALNSLTDYDELEQKFTSLRT